ncbi:CopG domain protein DNA-binding domain protein [Sulfolobus islandicus L.S.2.15]|uniref:CopG domain protein DNA-binding domain protein n=1 Tax=Saccharolobus islandicus (strain L.S.2.15 / Lassen \|nr:DUF6290 family protein [Sulfolobus islandicus]ACP34313.1 CopG domain protein DNA-binding domain protein [Sulfolobus islandicus L.S.2.15]
MISKDWGMDIISFRLPPEMNAKLEKIAHKKRISKSELIRMAIVEYISNHGE